jgi:hypothetical protein
VTLSQSSDATEAAAAAFQFASDSGRSSWSSSRISLPVAFPNILVLMIGQKQPSSFTVNPPAAVLRCCSSDCVSVALLPIMSRVKNLGRPLKIVSRKPRKTSHLDTIVLYDIHGVSYIHCANTMPCYNVLGRTGSPVGYQCLECTTRHLVPTPVLLCASTISKKIIYTCISQK